MEGYEPVEEQRELDVNGRRKKQRSCAECRQVVFNFGLFREQEPPLVFKWARGLTDFFPFQTSQAQMRPVRHCTISGGAVPRLMVANYRRVPCSSCTKRGQRLFLETRVR
jgi:hypothetical protein